MPLACFDANSNISAHFQQTKRTVPLVCCLTLVCKTTPFQEIILSSGVFRRETASGFYPWGKVDSPRKRVAEGLCGWRHGNSFPMTQSRTIPLPNAKHSTLPQGCFFMFLFLIPFTIRQQCIIYPQEFSTEPKYEPLPPNAKT